MSIHHCTMLVQIQVPSRLLELIIKGLFHLSSSAINIFTKNLILIPKAITKVAKILLHIVKIPSNQLQFCVGEHLIFNFVNVFDNRLHLGLYVLQSIQNIICNCGRKCSGSSRSKWCRVWGSSRSRYWVVGEKAFFPDLELVWKPGGAPWTHFYSTETMFLINLATLAMCWVRMRELILALNLGLVQYGKL